jgi:peptidoglycan/LPS O-acetylase OafA/YrhL
MSDRAIAAPPHPRAAPSNAPAPGPAARLGWLDALRGFAALTVVCFHLSPYLVGPGFHQAVLRHIDLGKYGVMLFFLVSGYVIPMSLERHGSLRRFWVGRVFRIYPAFAVAIAVMAVFIVAGVLPLQASLRAETVSGALAHLTMLSDLVGLRGVVRVFWTLSYEMTFYLIVAGLFAYRLHRRSAWWAAGLALTALLAGGLLPNGLLTPGFASRRVVAALLALAVAASLLAYLSGRRPAVLAAGALGIGFVLLPALNGSSTDNSTVISSWQALLLLAVMFAGTVVYHAQHALIGRRAAAAALVVVLGCVVGAHWAHLPALVASATGLATQRAVWIGTTAAVAVTFATGYALRHRRVPRALTWLGAISYSLYLLHAIALLLFVNLLPDAYARPLPARVAIGVGFVAVSLAAAWLSYRFVERPAQALGRRLGAWLDARLGADAGPRPTPALRPRQEAPDAGRPVT